MAHPSSPSEWFSPGYFGPVTATLDWCESNYQFSYYIAEMANTFSNLFTIGLAVFGGVIAVRQSLPARYIAAYVGFALVGIGSFAFHATLLFQAQLADELPMIYVGSMGLWFLFDIKAGFGIRTSHTKLTMAVLVAFDILFTWSYIIYRNPVYHQAVFATLASGTAFRVTHLLKWSRLTSSIPEKKKLAIGKMFGTGAALFGFGFLIWNLDNIYCNTLTRWRMRIGWPYAFLLEGHSWWHVFTGAGTYYMFAGIQYLTLCIKDNHKIYTVGHLLGLPHIFRVERKQ